MKSLKFVFLAMLAILPAETYAGVKILAPVAGYVSGSEYLWVVVESGKPPLVEVDNVKAKGSFTGEGKIRHLRVGGISPSGSVLKVDGQKVEVSFKKGSPYKGEPLFHDSFAKNCGECHEAEGSCRDCHKSYGTGKHGKPDFAKKCSSCHKAGMPSSEETVKLCAGCHEKYSLSKHPKLRHPVTSKNDPSRPGRRMDCVSCHDPHGPRDLSGGDGKEWCKECHANP
ncbi:hypothetical protein EPN96_11840 [bacterium]|nr:MAG: hypothetical protein EPN96_11840 [bacterium]